MTSSQAPLLVSQPWVQTAGVRQIRVLGPLLLSFVYHLLLRHSTTVRQACLGGPGMPPNVTLLLYADDLVVLPDRPSDLQHALHAIGARWRSFFWIGPDNTAVFFLPHLCTTARTWSGPSACCRLRVKRGGLGAGCWRVPATSVRQPGARAKRVGHQQHRALWLQQARAAKPRRLAAQQRRGCHSNGTPKRLEQRSTRRQVRWQRGPAREVGRCAARAKATPGCASAAGCGWPSRVSVVGCRTLDFHVTFHDVPMPMVPEYCCLGVVFQSALRWNQHRKHSYANSNRKFHQGCQLLRTRSVNSKLHQWSRRLLK